MPLMCQVPNEDEILGADLCSAFPTKFQQNLRTLNSFLRSGSCSISAFSNLRNDFSPSSLVLLTHHRVQIPQESHVPIIHTKRIRWRIKRARKGKSRSKFSFLNVSTRQLLASVMIPKKNELLPLWFNLLKVFIVHKAGIVLLGLEAILKPQREEELKE